MSLYPPIIIDTIMPAFTNEAIIKFQLSPYVEQNQIQAVHLVLTTQYNNQSVLNPEEYPLEIAEFEMSKIHRNENGFFILTFNNSILKPIKKSEKEEKIQEFLPDIFYKAQLRFASKYAGENFDANFITLNANNFSEWSKPCLIKHIDTPKLNLEGFEGISNGGLRTFTRKFNRFKGNLEINSKTEYLYSYSLTFFELESQAIVEKSGWQKADEYSGNIIDYTVKTKLKDFTNYKLTVVYKTNTGYENEEEFLFQFDTTGLPKIENSKIIATSNNPKGCIEIVISQEGKGLSENIMICRTSSKSGFTEWEDVHLFSVLEDGNWSYKWIDYLVEAGVIYKYGFQLYYKYIQEGTERETRGEMPDNQITPVVATFEDIFLYDGSKQLRIKFDPNISSFKQSISESKVETIGSKYPFIRRNANVNYRTFPISGIITYKNDDYSEDYPFEDCNLQLSNQAQNFTFFNRNSQEIKDYESIIKYGNNYESDLEVFLEKQFRDKVMKFLYDGRVKLFKSETEGNILVRLMDISFTPNKSLGRRIYSFSATAYEIDEPTFENYKKYNLFNLGDFQKILFKTDTHLGQFTNNKNPIINLIDKEISKTENTVRKISRILWLRIIFNSKPYVITKSNKSLVGYSVSINGSTFVINKNGVLEISLKDFSNISAISIDNTPSGYSLDYDIDYLAEIYVTENTEKKVIESTKRVKVGQLQGPFDSDSYKDIIKEIRSKYFLEWIPASNDTFKGHGHYKRVDSINSLDIEAPPGTVLYWKDSQDAVGTPIEQHRHIIGFSGILHIYNPNGIVQQLRLVGIRLTKTNSSGREVLKDWEYAFETENEASDLKQCKHHRIYGDKIYYKDNLYPFEYENPNDKENSPIIVKCPIDALINYCYEIEEGVYQGNAQV